MDSFSTWTSAQLVAYFTPKILYAVVCGGIVGLERELKNKPAGIKTNILICMGAALYSSLSVVISNAHAASGYYGDPGRLAAQIVSGIGFLGGGTIIQSRGTIIGLTTAATIWVVAAIGIAIGIGHPEIGLVASVVVVLTLVGTSAFEDRVLGRSLTFSVEVVADDPEGKVRLAINHALGQNNLQLDDFDLSTREGKSLMVCRYSGYRGDHKKFVLDLWGTPGIKEVRQL